MEAVSAGASRWSRIRGALTPAEWRRAAALAAAVIGLHVVGFVLLLAVVVPHDLSLGAQGAFGVGLGITAYTLGLRHAFDADHIGAIDNTTRDLQTEGQRPLSVGFFFSLGHSTAEGQVPWSVGVSFSLGHSTVVFLLGSLFSVGVRGLSGSAKTGSSAPRS